MIFARPRTTEQLASVTPDPRYWQQVHRREQPQELREAGQALGAMFVKTRLHRDWAEDLGTGASAGAGNYPAKYSYNSNVANCGSATTPDYVIYSTGLQSSGTQASIVAFDNLYSGCGGTVPTTYWAYDTTAAGSSGAVLTSPIPSLDGTQVAFVQTNQVGHGIVVLLKWAANTGSIGTPVNPALAASALAYTTCTAPCMFQFGLTDRIGTPTGDQTSAIYYDFTGDIAWVGDSQGLLHQFHPFFKGTPAEIRNSLWPAPVHALSNDPLTSAIFDSTSNLLFVGDASGFLYSVNATTAAVTQSGQLDFGTGVVQGPVVDTLNQLVYVFASSDGTTNCTAGVACAAVYKLNTTFAATTTGTKVTVGNSLVSGSTPNPMFLGGFDTAYYSSGNATGNLYVCGNTGAIPTLYQIPITAGAFPGAGTSFSPLGKTGSTAGCSSVTDVPNPNTTGGPSERLFVSVQNNGVSTGCTSGGCIMTFLDTPWKASTAYSVGQQVLSSRLHVETVITAGTSGASAPSWSSSAGGLTNDGTAPTTVVWIDEGVLDATTISAWQANHSYGTATDRILDSNGNVQISKTTGTSGASAPAFNTTPGGTTPDGPDTLVWTNAGPVGAFALRSTAGTSGIISDNVVGTGTLAGASQVYFTTLGNQSCTGGTGGCAVQASQPALQ